MTLGVSEIRPGVYCLTFAPNNDFSYNSFLIQAEKNLLIHTGRKQFFGHTRALVESIIGLSELHYITFSHFEPDECGALNNFLELAPDAVTLVSPVGRSNVDDFAIRPCRCVRDGEIIELGPDRTIEILETPHFPHGWDATLFYLREEKILFSSDFGAHGGVREAVTEEDRTAEIIAFQQQFGFMPEGFDMRSGLDRIAPLRIELLATQHGSVLRGEYIKRLIEVMRSTLALTGKGRENRQEISCDAF